MTELRKKIIRLIGDVEEVFAILFTNSDTIEIPRGKKLLKQGEICEYYYFMEQGSIRIFHKKNDKDYTLWFASAGEIFTNLDSYNNQTPSDLIYEALEFCKVRRIKKDANDKLISKYPSYNTLLRKNLEETYIYTCKNIMAYQSESAIERYKKLELQNDWLLNFPLKYIASFLGVTKSSLSRIRKNRD